MAMLFGPILGWRGEQDGAWRMAVAVVCDDAMAPETVTWSASGQSTTTPLSRTSTLAGATVYAAELSISLTAARQGVEYGIAGDDRRWRVSVPGTEDRPRIAYGSCNGFSLPGDMRKITDKNHLWRELVDEHARQPFDLLLMGGDQIYADQLWDVVPELRRFNELPRDRRTTKKAGASLQRNLEKFFLDTYKDRFGAEPIATALASIPSVMMWDDHDIFDGWGSYSPEEQASPVFQAVFATARKAFALFQLQSDPDTVSWPRLPQQTAFNALLRFGDSAILVLDIRSERTQTRILTQPTWDAVLDAVDAAHGLKHLLVMSSIPVLHPDMSFLERGLGLLPGNQGIEDDLNDQWLSYNHKTERLRMIHRLLDFAAANGTRVTIVSGDVHVAALGVIESSRRRLRDTNAGAITQLTSSAIVHPPPPRVVRFFLEQVGANVQEIDRDITGRMLQFPATGYRFVAERNWMSLEFDESNRIWVNWRIEGAPQPLTKVIHPCTDGTTGATLPSS